MAGRTQMNQQFGAEITRGLVGTLDCRSCSYGVE
jgi:hypothetical protein